jgi:hypothetical protein
MLQLSVKYLLIRSISSHTYGWLLAFPGAIRQFEAFDAEGKVLNPAH